MITSGRVTTPTSHELAADAAPAKKRVRAVKLTLTGKGRPDQEDEGAVAPSKETR